MKEASFEEASMKIKDRPEYKDKPAPLTCSPDDFVRPAVEQMAEKNFGSVIVVDNKRKVVGMVTERDIFKRVVAERRDPDTTRISEIMTTEVRKAREDDDLTDWLRIMSNERFRRLPIVDNDGTLVSVMSQGDFVSYTWPQIFSQLSTITRSTVSKNYQVALIIGAILVYTIILLSFFNQ